MKIAQEPVFKPITIVLETYDEAQAFFGIVSGESDDRSEDLAKSLSDWFTTQAHLYRTPESPGHFPKGTHHD